MSLVADSCSLFSMSCLEARQALSKRISMKVKCFQEKFSGMGTATSGNWSPTRPDSNWDSTATLILAWSEACTSAWQASKAQVTRLQ